ncbi:NADH-quinone oxidoreductase subunit L [Verrucomicrobia bacterium LW23]|nr:NADH-quinone oxidoreductase subunit L [Verrucomicrobia bacterium LW23]
MAFVKNAFQHDILPADTPLINVQIDGEWVQVPKGLNAIEAASRAGKFVPHYCYHPKLSIVGNCRMCLLEIGMPKMSPDRKPIIGEDGKPEIGWIPRPAIGCATQLADGMGIRTDSKLAKDCREGVMEFLLINHPLDCPICDQAGECKLQEYSVEYGQSESRFVEQKVHKPKKVDIGERIVLDDERCIMCSRCIRFAREFCKDDVLGFTQRGGFTTLAVHHDKRFDNNYSLNTVDICPVGALTSKDFRFKMRVWFLRETPSVCTGCATGCNVTVGAREQTVYRLTPRENEDVNSLWMCDQGRLNIGYFQGPDRLTEPLVRVGGSQVGAVWSNIYPQIQHKMLGLKGEQVAILASARATNEELFVIADVRRSLGGDTVLADIVPRPGKSDGVLQNADRNPNSAGTRIFGLNYKGQNIAKIKEAIDAGKIKALFCFHEDAVEAGIPAETLQKLDLLVLQHIVPGPTGALAHFVLAGAAWTEKRGSMINAAGRLQRLNKATACPGSAREDLEILLNLRTALTGGNSLHKVEEVFKAAASQYPIFEGLTFSRITDLGVQLDRSKLPRPQVVKGSVVAEPDFAEEFAPREMPVKSEGLPATTPRISA